MKHLLTSILASTLLLSTACFATETTATTLQEVETQQEIHTATLSSGKCGNNATYSYNSSTKTLTISGTGAMEDYGWDSPPWENFREDVKTLDIAEGIISIGGEAFSGFSSLTMVNFHDSITSIGFAAFSGCRSLTSIDLPKSITTIDMNLFWRVPF